MACAAVAAPACSAHKGPDRGGLMLIVDEDVPHGVDKIHIDVSAKGQVLKRTDYRVPEEISLPTTLGIVSNGDPALTVTLYVIGYRGAAPIDRRDAIVTQVPTDRVVEERIVLSARCAGQIVVGDTGDVHSMCGDGKTCDPDTAGCVSSTVNASMLPVYTPGDENRFDGGLPDATTGDATITDDGPDDSPVADSSADAPTDVEAGPVSRDCVDCRPKTIATLTNVASMTVGNLVLYYAESLPDAGYGATGPLMQVPTGGGTAMQVTLGYANTGQLRADGPYVYGVLVDMSNPSSVVASVPITGGYNFSAISGSPNYLLGIRTNSTDVFAYWNLSQYHLTRFPKAGGTSNPVISTPIGWLDFDVDDLSAYGLNASTVTGATVDGGSPGVLTTADATENLQKVQVDGSQLVVLTSKRIAKVAKTGGTLGTVVSIPDGDAYAFVADGSSVYYFRKKTVDAGATCDGGSELYGVALTGGTPWHIASEPGTCISNLVQDSAAVYWISGDHRLIEKALK
jgi:hypothetical protein